MIVTLKDGTRLTVTLRTWDGYNWSPDVAGDVLATWQPETQADIDWLVDDCDNFNAGIDLDWLEHCPTCQEVSLDVQEVQE
jgi:hypothetical protein